MKTIWAAAAALAAMLFAPTTVAADPYPYRITFTQANPDKGADDLFTVQGILQADKSDFGLPVFYDLTDAAGRSFSSTGLKGRVTGGAGSVSYFAGELVFVGLSFDIDRGSSPSYTADYFFDFAGSYGDAAGPVTEFRFGAVPEPASWALMIMGLGAAGAALRRRRPATPALA